MKTSSKYRIHRTIGIIVVPLLILSTATGFFRANQKWYWEDGYKKKKHSSDFSITGELIPISRIVQIIDSISQKKNQYQEINIRNENKKLYYALTTVSKEKYLTEVYTGKVVSPLSSQLASDFAVQYIKETAEVRTCELLKNYTPRKGKEAKPAYKVAFNNEVNSQIYLDYYTGEIIEDLDDNRRFGIWIIRLHDYDFFNSKRAITSVVGISILLLSLTGLWIYKSRLKLGK